MVRIHARIDRNHEEIVNELRKLGVTVQSIASIGHGCPDIVCGFRRRNFLFEIKDGLLIPSRRVLTPEEVCWHQAWQGQVDTVESLEEVLRVLEL